MGGSIYLGKFFGGYIESFLWAVILVGVFDFYFFNFLYSWGIVWIWLVD